MGNPTKTLRIDIVSDVVCPWCIIGYRQLQQALDKTGINADVQWHPFELNPTMPPEGQNMHEHIAEKYGSSEEDSRKSREHLSAVDSELGFSFSFPTDMRMVNTFDAHQLIHWAETHSRAMDMKLALFAKHFSENKDISHHETLGEVSQSIGLDRSDALQVLQDQRYAEAVRELQSYWLKQGIQGVPAVVFDSKYMVSGAQGVDQFEKCLLEVMKAKSQD